MKLSTIMTAAALLMATHTTYAQSQFARGADISWATEMEADGVQFRNADGEATDIFTLMKQIGMTAIRLRVWVNPTAYGYGAWSDPTDVVAKARRANAAGLDLMIDFHYSDFFADPSRQDTPIDWQGHSLEQLKQDVADHTTAVLQALKAEGITPKWVQVGNETTTGMMWTTGKIDWSKPKTTRFADYAVLSNAGYDAAKSVFPDVIAIVHHDNAYQDLVWFYQEFKDAGGKFDMIGLSHYPDYNNWNSTSAGVASNLNAATSVQKLGQTFGVPVMIVETGYKQWDTARGKQVMQDIFDRMTALTQCAGIFYWEPQVNGAWKPAYYTKVNWGAYDMGAFSADYRPTEILDPFKGSDTAVRDFRQTAVTGSDVCYNLQGQRVSRLRSGVYIVNGRTTVIANSGLHNER